MKTIFHFYLQLIIDDPSVVDNTGLPGSRLTVRTYPYSGIIILDAGCLSRKTILVLKKICPCTQHNKKK